MFTPTIPKADSTNGKDSFIVCQRNIQLEFRTIRDKSYGIHNAAYAFNILMNSQVQLGGYDPINVIKRSEANRMDSLLKAITRIRLMRRQPLNSRSPRMRM